MYTYQDLLNVNDDDKMEFVRSCISAHKETDLFKEASVAEQYNKHRNVTIIEYQKLLYTVTGKAVPDNWTANFKLASRFFNRFIVQENQYLLGNGVTWKNETADKSLGDDFDTVLQTLGEYALWGAVSFGFYNMDHVDAFNVLEFAPLFDEENGSLRSGIRFWQVDDDKPLRATLYEEDGYTDYIWNKKVYSGASYTLVDEVMHEKRPYKLKTRTTEADGTEIYDGENYPSFPIVPLWGNPSKQSELVGLREQIDCYDLIKSGYANNVDDGSLIYWTLQNAGGMDDLDLAQFVERMKTLKATALDSGVQAESHTVDVPYQSREALLSTLRADLYEDAMALDTKNIAGGAVTATQIRACYEPLNSKTDQFEYCVRKFLDLLLEVAGVEDEPTFTRSIIVNSQEEIGLVIQASQFLDQEYTTKKLLTLLGDGDMADEVLDRLAEEELARGEEELAMEGLEGSEIATDGSTEGDLDGQMLQEYSDEVIKMLEELVGG